MQISNPLQMNDWQIKSFLLLIFSIQISFLGLIVLDSINIQIPIIRQFISFIFLTFIPGFLILRIFNIHNLGNVKTVLYSVGLSIGSLMLIGLFMNTIYPFFGISRPISLFNLIITINLFMLLLSIFSYVRDKNFSKPNFVQVDEILSPSFLFLCLIPFFSIFGTYILNGYGNNTLQMVLLLIIAITPLVTLKWIPKKLYSFVIFVLSISLLLHTTLVSQYIWGADINGELILANYVIKNALWYPSFNYPINAMLSIVLLAPIYSITSNLSLPWCFKIIYPAIFSLVPVGLFVVYNKLSSDKIAFLACIFFISGSTFFTTLPAVSRQEIASIFLTLIIMILIERKIKENYKDIFLVLFGFSLVVSHYGIAYTFLLVLGVSILIVLILNRFPNKLRIRNVKFENFVKFEKFTILNNTFFLLFMLCFGLFWYIYVANSIIFQNGTTLLYIVSSSVTDLLNPVTSQAYNAVTTNALPFYQSSERILYLIGNLCIAVGIITSLSKKEINPEYKVFSISSLFLLFLAIILPYLASAMNTIDYTL